ncbi:uncharacterized protein METZ01_LOCUS317160, partial [marine metagenome]
MEEIMKTSKCLMGVLLSSVLLIGSVFANNTLHNNNGDAVDGYALKGYPLLKGNVPLNAYSLKKNINLINPNNSRECEDGFVDDCSGDGDCCPESWIGDGFEDCEDQAWGCDLTCYDEDGGDCAGGDTGGDTGGSETCADCEFDFTPYGSECCDTAWGEFGIDCATLEANYNWDCSGCNCPGDADPVCGDGSCNGDETYETCPDDCNAPGECDDGFVSDCVDDDCCAEGWIGDGLCDGEDQAWGCDLTCYDNDGGDCSGGGTT